MKCGEWRSNASHKITIQSKTLTGDDYGGQSLSWTNQSTPYAMIVPVSGREVFASQQLQSRVTHKMTIRYQSALKNTATTASYQVLYDDRIFSVKYIRNLDDEMKSEGKSYQELYVEENYPEND